MDAVVLMNGESSADLKAIYTEVAEKFNESDPGKLKWTEVDVRIVQYLEIK